MPTQAPLPRSAAAAPATEEARAPVALLCGGLEYTLGDLLTAAECLGDLTRFRAAWQVRERAARAAEAAGLTPTSDAVDEAVSVYRYARDLVSGEECEAWLTERGLTFDDLAACVTRRLQAQIAAPPRAIETSLDETHFRRDALLAEEFNAWGHRFARHLAAVVEVAGALPASGEVAAHWPRLQATYAATAERAATQEGRQRVLGQQRMRLLRLAYELAEFDSLDAAREAMLCAREDNAPLSDIAAANGFPCRTLESFVGDLPPSWVELLAGTRVGEPVIPPPTNHAHLVLSIARRSEPTLADAAVCARIDHALVEQQFRALEGRHITWRINVEVSS